MAKNRKTVLAIVLAVKRGFVSPEEGMKILEQAESGDATQAEATVFGFIPTSHQEELRADAAELAEDNSQATRILEEAGVPPDVQQTLLSLGTAAEPNRDDVEATLLSLAPTTANTQVEMPQVKSAAERYQVLREHARGGMGRILIAVDKVVGREVALKELLPFKNLSGSSASPGTPMSATSTTATARFLREATVTGQLEHPNIVPVYEIGQRDDGSLYYTMKFVKGRTLATRLRAIRNDVDLSPEEKLTERLKLLDGFVDVCNAIAFAHSRGVIHRDIKPANIMLGDFGEALVLDWGLARIRGGEDIAMSGGGSGGVKDSQASAEITLEGEVMGTPAYMPPEQAAGKLAAVDERSDVYSLGAVLFEIVSGEPPYQGKTAKQVLSSVLSEQPRLIREISPDAPPELAALVQRALARNPAERFKSARQLAEQVQAYRDGRMVGAYSYSTAELIARFVRKNRAAVSITLLALLLLIGGGVYAYTTVKAQRDAALAAEADALQQRTLADQQAAEAKRQKGIAEDEAAEAERQKGIAQTAAKDAADARDDAKLQAAEAERQQKIAELSARRAELSAQAAEAAEARANNALDEARSNLAQAHLGYAQLAKERNQPGEQIVHLAAAHAADDKVVSVDRLVSTLHQTVFPVWSTRSYVDLPADVASFTPDCRLCAAPLHEAPKGMDELDTTGDNVELPDIGIWDVASGTLLRRIKTGSHIQRRLLLNADGTRLAALDATGKLQLWDVTSGDEISNRSLFDWTDVPLIVPGAGRETFFTATPAGNINEWHFADGTPGRSVKAEDEPNSLAASPDGVHVAVSNWLGTVAVWELGSDQPPVRKALDESSKLVGFGPDGPLISHKTEVMFDDVIDIQLWDMKLENQLRTFPTRSWQISSVAVNQAGTHLAAGLYGGGWKLYDYTTGNVVQQRGKSGGNVVAVSFAPDGESLVLAQKGEGFDVLKIGGDPLVSRSPDHTLGSMSVQFSPDGKYFASAGFDGRVLLRNATDGSSVWALTVSESRLLRTAFSPDGSTLAAYSADQVISFVDVSSGRLKQSLSLGIYSYGMKFTPDGQYLTAPTRDGPIHLIDPTTAKIAKTVTLDNGEYVISLNCDPNSNRLYMLDHYMTLWAWNWDDGRPAARLGQLSFGTEANVTKSIYNSTIGPDGHSLIISVGDGSILGCTPEPFAQLFTAQIGAGPIVNSAFGRSSGFIVCGTGDGILCFVDANTGEVVKKQRAHDAAIVAVAVSPDGRNIVTSAVDGEFRSWSAPAFMYSEQRRIGVVRAGTPALSPDGKLLAAGVDSNMIRVIDVASGDTVDEFTIEGNYVAGLKFTPDNRGLVASLSPGRLLIRNLADGATRRFALNDGAGGIDFDDEGHLLVVGLYYGLQVRDLATGELVRTVPKTTGFYQVSALPGGKTVLLTGSLDEPRIVNLADGETIATLERGGYGTNASCVSPDGETLAIVRDVGLIGLHRVTDGKRLRNLKVRNTNIQAVEFLPQKDRLFYLTGDGVGVVVDINSGQELLETWFPYSYTVGGMLLPDGSQALAVGSGGVYELWNLAPQLDRLQSLSNLSVEQLEALTQILAGMKLERLNALHLPRRTGNISWLTPDGQPPAFLAGDLPAWVPRLDGKDIAEARTYLQKLNDTRNAGIDAFAMSWQDGFEGYRYREELQPDLTVERVKVPEREKDANGNYIGEPVGEIDFVAWLTDHRKVTDAARQERVKHYAELEGKAAADGDWELARVYCEVLKALEPTKLDWIIEYCRASLGIQSYWMPTWTLEMNIGRATPEQKPEMLLLWARMMSTSGNLQGMLERFDAARDAGYIADDWHLYRARALEESGAFKQAVAAGERGVAECKDASVVTELLLLRARCLAWLSISKGIDDLPRVAITLVTEGSEAERAGLKAGDLLLGFKAGEEERLTTDAYGQIALDSDWKNFLDTAAPEIQTATLKVRRDGVEIEIEYPRKPFDFGRFTLRPPRE